MMNEKPRLEKRQKNSRVRLILVILAISLILLLTSCQSYPIDANELYWPPFPDPQGVVKHDLTTDTVSMPLWYWIDVTNYVIEIEQNIEVLHPP